MMLTRVSARSWPEGQGRCSFASAQHWQATSGVLCPVLGSPGQKRCMDILEQGQQRTRKTIMGLKHLTCKERLRAGIVQLGEVVLFMQLGGYRGYGTRLF